MFLQENKNRLCKPEDKEDYKMWVWLFSSVIMGFLPLLLSVLASYIYVGSDNLVTLVFSGEFILVSIGLLIPQVVDFYLCKKKDKTEFNYFVVLLVLLMLSFFVYPVTQVRKLTFGGEADNYQKLILIMVNVYLPFLSIYATILSKKHFLSAFRYSQKVTISFLVVLVCIVSLATYFIAQNENFQQMLTYWPNSTVPPRASATYASLATPRPLADESSLVVDYDKEPLGEIRSLAIKPLPIYSSPSVSENFEITFLAVDGSVRCQNIIMLHENNEVWFEVLTGNELKGYIQSTSGVEFVRFGLKSD